MENMFLLPVSLNCLAVAKNLLVYHLVDAASAYGSIGLWQHRPMAASSLTADDFSSSLAIHQPTGCICQQCT